MTPEQVVARAMEKIEKDGWNQGDYWQHPNYAELPQHDLKDDPFGFRTNDDIMYAQWLARRTAPVCALGALRRVVYEQYEIDWFGEGGVGATELYGQAAQLLADAVVGDSCHFEDSVPMWNDDPRTTKEDVLLGFKKVVNRDS